MRRASLTRGCLQKAWLPVLALFIGAWLAVSESARAEPTAAAGAGSTVLAGTNVAALAVVGETLLVGGFDSGVSMVDPRGVVSRLEDPAVNANVNALLVDRVGALLYIATARGLARCSVRVRRCERLGAPAAVHALVELRDGTVLAGGDGGLLAVSPTGHTIAFDRKGGAPFRAVWALAEAADGTVLVGATNGLSWAAPTFLRSEDPALWKRRFHRASMVTGDLPDDWVTALAVDGVAVHVGTYNSGIVSFRFEHGRLTRTATDESVGYVNPAGILMLPEGRLAVATMDGLRVGVPLAWTAVATPARDVTALARTASGTYFVATRQGIAKVEVASK